MKKTFLRLITFILCIIIISSFSLASAVSLTDIQNHWAYKEINFFANEGIISGYGGGIFKPNNSITRAEFCKIIIESMKKYNNIEYATIETSFEDAQNSWYTVYISTALELGIVTGVGNNKFEPNELLTREQMAKIVANVYCLIYNTTIDEIASPENSFKGYSDSDDISKWAQKYISAATNKNLMKGKAEGFEPKSYTTRAETSVLLFRLYNIEIENYFSSERVELTAFLQNFNKNSILGTCPCMEDTLLGTSTHGEYLMATYPNHFETFNILNIPFIVSVKHTNSNNKTYLTDISVYVTSEKEIFSYNNYSSIIKNLLSIIYDNLDEKEFNNIINKLKIQENFNNSMKNFESEYTLSFDNATHYISFTATPTNKNDAKTFIFTIKFND